jgi:hypothetical protein
LQITACGQGDTEASRPTAGKRPDEAPRATIAQGLRTAGKAIEADIVMRRGSRVTRVSAPFLRAWRIYQVDGYTDDPRPVWFRVGVDNNTQAVLLLSGDPAAFNKMTKAGGVRVTNKATAMRLGRTFIRTTRPVQKFTYIVGHVDQIRFRPNLSGAEARRRDRLVKRYARVVAPPKAVADGEGFEVTAHVVVLSDNVLQRRTLEAAADGRVRQRAKTLAREVPLPWVL